SSSSMPAPMRLPINPPSAAPAIPAATRSPAPPPNCDPIRPPATAPTSVPVFSRGPVPVSGLPLHAANDSATSAAALRRTNTMCEAPTPSNRRSPDAGPGANSPKLGRNFVPAGLTRPLRPGDDKLGAQPPDRGGAQRECPAVEGGELDHDRKP